MRVIWKDFRIREKGLWFVMYFLPKAFCFDFICEFLSRFSFLIMRPRHIFRLMTATFIHCRISTLDFNASLLDSRECQFLLSDLFLLHPGINPQPNVLDYTLLFSERHDFFFRSGYRPSHFLCIIASFFILRAFLFSVSSYPTPPPAIHD